jgi:hypothetical protein
VVARPGEGSEAGKVAKTWLDDTSTINDERPSSIGIAAGVLPLLLSCLLDGRHVWREMA